MKTMVIFDIDGTVADNTHRVHHVQQEKKNWTAFFDGQHLDTPYEHMQLLVDLYSAMPVDEIVFLTGRGEEHREVTEEWLEEHGFPYDQLIMRPAGDRTDDHLIKIAHIKGWKDDYKILGFFDDRLRVCNAVRELDVPVFQMSEGDF